MPKVGERVDLGALPKLDPDRFWGMVDQALLPVSWATLPYHCDDLAIRKIAGADHWLVHQKTDEVTGLIDDFLPG